LTGIEDHRRFMTESPEGPKIEKRKEKVQEELADMVKSRLIHEIFVRLRESGQFNRAVESILAGEMDPYTACDSLILPKLPATDDS
jgi:LAO/AO transport system kinase